MRNLQIFLFVIFAASLANAGDSSYIQIFSPTEMSLPLPERIHGKAVKYKISESPKSTEIEFNFSEAAGTPSKTKERVIVTPLPNIQSKKDIDYDFLKAFPGTSLPATAPRSANMQFREVIELANAQVHVFYLRGAMRDVDRVYVLSNNGKGAILIESPNPLTFDWKRLKIQWK